MQNKLISFCFLLLTHFNLCAQNKPNVLWITIEDTSPQFIGCYGNSDASTPNIDNLAKNGIKFSNAFSTGTVCSPSRTAIITGVKTYEAGTGNHRSNYPIPAIIHGFPYYLQQAGYYTTNNSKTDYNVKNPKAFIEDAWDESSNNAGWWNRKAGQPFFAVFNFMDSHQSRTMTDTYPKYLEEVINKLPESDRISEQDFKMPPFYKDSPEMRKQFARVYNAIKLTDNKIGELIKKLEEDKLRDSTIIFFYADHGEGIPRGKTNGINLGHRVPFVIWFPEMYKHLSPWGQAGMVTDELIDFTDLAPTLISLAGGNLPDYLKGRILMGPKRSKEADHLVLSSDRSDNGIDLTRTVTDGKYVYSRNFLPYMPEARYIRYMEIGDIKQQMRADLVAGKLNSLQKSLFEPRPAEFLFDIENDSWETKNLINDKKYTQLVVAMRQKLKNEMFNAKDILLLPEYEIAKISETTTPYSYRLSAKNFPFKDIYEAAVLSGFRSKEVAHKQVALLKSPNNIVKYWAAVGLRSQDILTMKPFKSELFKAMSDPYEPTSVMINALVWEVFQEANSEQNLKKLISSSNDEVALAAINEVLYFTNKEPFIQVVKAKHESYATLSKAAKADAYKVKAACVDVLGSVGLVPNNPSYSD